MSKPSPEEFMGSILPTLFVPDKARGWNRIIQFSLSDAGDWVVEIKDQKISIQKRRHPKPQLEIRTDFDTLYGIFTGEVFPPTAISQKKMKAFGPTSDQLMFSKVFKRLEKK